MKPIQLDTALTPKPDAETGDGFAELAFIDPRGIHSIVAVRNDAKRTMHNLLYGSFKLAVLLERGWQTVDNSFSFEHLPVYEEIAGELQCFIVTIQRPQAGGTEHMLFATKQIGRPDEEYLVCIDRVALPIVDARVY